MAVYGENGHLVAWDADTSQIITDHALEIVTAKGVVFDPEGMWVAGPTTHEFSSGDEYIGGIKFWDVKSGKFLRCYYQYHCASKVPENDSTGVAVDSSGQFFFTYTELTYNGQDLSGKTVDIVRGGVQDSDSDYLWVIGQIVPYQTGNVILIFEEGRVTTGGNAYAQILASGKAGDRQAIQAATLDLSEHWLAFVRGKELSVYELGLNAGLRWEKPVSNTVQILFDRTSQVLFLAGDGHIAVWDLEQKLLLKEYDAPGVTALDISQDNRLLLWGDEQGAVHLWAIQATPQAP